MSKTNRKRQIIYKNFLPWRVLKVRTILRFGTPRLDSEVSLQWYLKLRTLHAVPTGPRIPQFRAYPHQTASSPAPERGTLPGPIFECMHACIRCIMCMQSCIVRVGRNPPGLLGHPRRGVRDAQPPKTMHACILRMHAMHAYHACILCMVICVPCQCCLTHFRK